MELLVGIEALFQHPDSSTVNLEIINLLISTRGSILTCERFDCLVESFAAWVDSCEANADRERVTERASFANLLNPPACTAYYQMKLFKVVIIHTFCFILNWLL